MGQVQNRMYIAGERSDERTYKVISHSPLSFERPRRKMDYDVVRIVGKDLVLIRALPGVKILLDERTNVYRCRLGSLHFRAPFGKTRNGRAIGGKCMPPGQGSRFENQMNYGHPHKRMNRADSETSGSGTS